MDDFNQKKNSAAPIIAVILLALLIGIGGYMYMKNKQVVTPSSTQTAETTPPAPAPVAESPVATTTPEGEKPLVVETKKLDIPASDDTKAEPTAVTDPKVAAMMTPRTLGNAAAPVKITEYASLTCSHCGAFHRESFEKFKTQFIDTGKVQMTFKEFPLNQPAMDASLILRCMPEDKYISFMSLLFQEQDKWAYDANYKDSLKQNAKLAGMSDETFDSCLANTALKQAILSEMKAAGDKYKVQSTPSFVFNNGQNVLVGNQPLEEFAKAIDTAGKTPSSDVTAPASPAPPVKDAAPAPASTDEETPPAE